MPTNSSRIDPVARESQVIAFLDHFPRDLSPILIGGYAIAAYGPPRFSVDVDLVLPRDMGAMARSWFKEEGVDCRETMGVKGAAGPISKLLISRGLVSGDIYLGGLRARESGVIVPYEQIARKPTTDRLPLTTGSTQAPFPVARPEALWVLKLLAGRPEDLTDLFVISERSVDSSEISSMLSALSGRQVTSHLRSVASRLDSDKEYRDALSRRGLGSPTDAKNQKLWAKFKRQALGYLSSYL